MPYDTGEPEHDERRSRRWPSVLTFPVLLVIGWVLYELTWEPALGVAAVCIKFGWEDFRTAFWLRRADPDWRRGRASFWLYLAAGLWKMAITASLMIFAYITLKVLGALGPRAAGHVVGAILSAFAGIALAALTACWAVVLALLWRIKLWLSTGVHGARRKNLWPPPHWPPHSSNLAGLLLGTSLFATLVPAMLVGLIAVVTYTLGPINQAGPAPVVVLLGFPVVCLLLVLFLLYGIRRVLAPRIFALTPQECWTAKEIEQKPVETYVGDEVEASRWSRSPSGHG
jgi:hypothetical protein